MGPIPLKPALLARITLPCLLLAGLALPALPSVALAEQPRDWALDSRPEGTVVNADVVFPGFGTSIEHRKQIYGAANELLLRAEVLSIVPLSEVLVDIDLRILFFTLGLQGGVRDTYRNLDMSNELDLSRKRRAKKESDGEINNALWGWGELRLGLTIPMNKYLVVDHITALRTEGRPDRTFDWRSGIVHDGDVMKSTTWVAFKHRDWGAIAPVFQLLVASLDGGTQTFLNYGVALITRPGIFQRNDLALLEMIFNLGPEFGGDNGDGYFGIHSIDAPFVVRTGYRVVFDIPNTAVDEDAVPLYKIIEDDL